MEFTFNTQPSFTLNGISYQFQVGLSYLRSKPELSFAEIAIIARKFLL